MTAYELIQPDGPCVSPDGHECTEAFSLRSPVPVSAHCARCGKPWTVVTFQS